MSRPLMIAITGGSGSGKTTITRHIKERCRDLDILTIPQDHYYRDWTHLEPAARDLVNFDHPDALDGELIYSQLKSMAGGEAIDRPTYDFKLHARSSETVRLAAAPVVIYDGILALHEGRVRDLFDLRIFVDVADDIRFIRRLKRDVAERGRTIDGVIAQYLATVKPMHDQFVAPTRASADLVINWETTNERAVQICADLIHQMVRRR